MRRQCVPGSLSSPPESEPGFEAISGRDLLKGGGDVMELNLEL